MGEAIIDLPPMPLEVQARLAEIWDRTRNYDAKAVIKGHDPRRQQ